MIKPAYLLNAYNLKVNCNFMNKIRQIENGKHVKKTDYY